MQHKDPFLLEQIAEYCEKIYTATLSHGVASMDDFLNDLELQDLCAFYVLHIGEFANGDFDAVYMGTLAMRSQQSKSAFDKIIKGILAKEVLFDVNFRGDFYSKELVDELLSHTTILKVSDEEIGFFGKENPEIVCWKIAKEHHRLKYICVTLGKDGAFVFDCKKNCIYKSEKPKSKPISTVGAGDSFAAAFLTSLISGCSPEISLKKAVALSDFVVTQLGAVPNYDINGIYKGI